MLQRSALWAADRRLALLAFPRPGAASVSSPRQRGWLTMMPSTRVDNGLPHVYETGTPWRLRLLPMPHRSQARSPADQVW